MKRLLAIAVAAAALATVPAVATAPAAHAATPCPAVLAHMGLHWPYAYPPENSTGALWDARSNGVSAVETDVQFSKPTATQPYGIPMVLHDATVDRMTNRTGYVNAYTAGQLITMRLVQQPWGTYATGYTVPSLYTYLYWARQWGVKTEVEVKATTLTPGQAATVAQRFQWLNDWSLITVSSFHAQPLAQLRQADARFTGRTVLLSIQPTADTAGDEMEDIYYSNLTSSAAATLHAAGLRVGAWTPDTSAGWSTALADGADQITSNNAVAARTWVGQHCG